MARIQQKRSGKKLRPRAVVNGHELREALRTTMAAKGMATRHWSSGFGLEDRNQGGKPATTTTA